MQDDLILFFSGTNGVDVDNKLEFFDDSDSEKILYFQTWVQNKVDGGFGYIESMAQFCEEFDIDEENINKYISLALKEKIYAEAVDLHLIKTSRLEKNVGQIF